MLTNYTIFTLTTKIFLRPRLQIYFSHQSIFFKIFFYFFALQFFPKMARRFKLTPLAWTIQVIIYEFNFSFGGPSRSIFPDTCSKNLFFAEISLNASEMFLTVMNLDPSPLPSSLECSDTQECQRNVVKRLGCFVEITQLGSVRKVRKL